MPETVRNPGRYRQMLEPFPSIEAANAALDEFWKELVEIRAKHKIPDVHIIMRFTYIGTDAEGQEAEGEVTTAGHIGNSLNTESMCAYAYGIAQSERETNISRLVKKGVRKLADKDE